MSDLRILLDFDGDRRDIAVYEKSGGYKSLRAAFKRDPGEVVTAVDGSGLRGRGGAGFPTGRKASFLPKDRKPAYLCVNADESEPGTFKDREIMLRNPHALIEGVLIMSYGIGATSAFIYIRGEYRAEFEVLQKALEEARSKGYVGAQRARLRVRRDGRAAPRRRRVHLRRGDGAAVVARGRARPAAVEAAVPGGRRPLRSADAGQQRRDAGVGAVHPRRWAAEAYAAIGTERSKGTRVFSLSGNVRRPGNYELPSDGDAARPDRGPRRRRPRGAHDEGDHSRRLVDADPDARPARHRHRLRVDRRSRLDGRARVRWS